MGEMAAGPVTPIQAVHYIVRLLPFKTEYASLVKNNGHHLALQVELCMVIFSI